MSDTDFTNAVSLTDASWFDDTNSGTYNTLFNATGTNTIAATAPSTYNYSSTGPLLKLIPPFTNTTTVTLNLTPNGGAALGAKNVFAFGTACAGGEIQQNVPVLVAYDGTQFNVINPIGRRLTNSLSANVLLSTTALFFDGPSVAPGTSGTWFVTGGVTLRETGGAANFSFKLWDGATVIDSGRASSIGANNDIKVSLSGYITSPAGDVRISAKDESTTTGAMTSSSSGEGKDSTITAIRIG